MKHYNIYIEDIYGDRNYILAINEIQLNRLVESFLNGEPYVNIKGVSRKLVECKKFIIYSITSFDMVGKSQEIIEEIITKEKIFFNQGKISLRLYKRYGTNITDNFTNGLGFGELKDLSPKKTKKIANPKNKIFISHATKNKIIVSKFCDLILDNALNIDTTEKVFNTSLEGSKPETGEDFRYRIKEELSNAKLVLQFISEDYKSSEVCLNEKGAAWVLCENVFPLIIEENEYEVGFIHSTTQQIQLHNENHIFKLIDDLRKKGIVDDFSVERVNQKIKEFVIWLKENKKEKTPETIKEKTEVKSHSETDYPFFKINKHTSVYLLQEGKYCLIPDQPTLKFLGGTAKKLNRIDIPTEAISSYLGQTIQSVLKGELWTNDVDKKNWLIYKNRRHLVDVMTYQILVKSNPNIIRALVSSDQLNQLIEGDFFTLKGANKA